MSVPPIQTPVISPATPVEDQEQPGRVSAVQNLHTSDSIQRVAPASSRWSWSYTKIAVVAFFAIGACALAAFVMKTLFRDTDREAEYRAQIAHYRNQLRGSA